MKKVYKIILIVVLVIFLFSLSHCVPVIVHTTNEGFKKMVEHHSSQNTCQKVDGFDGILCSPDYNGNPCDIYSTSEGSLSNKSYGYTNSRGFLDMNSEQLRLLTTRGGNATN
jgi:hypothetical protein